MARRPGRAGSGAVPGSEPVRRDEEEDDGAESIDSSAIAAASFFLFFFHPHDLEQPRQPKTADSDNLRGFFEACFPTLLREVFGFDGSCWLAQAARPGRDGEAAARALLRLLDPTSGTLLRAVRAVDAEGAVLFSFPVERLPGRTQLLLASPTGRA